MTDVEKLQSLIDEADSLIQRRVNSMSPEFTAWQVKTGRFLEKTYGLESYEFASFAATRFSPRVLTNRAYLYELASACTKGLEATKQVLMTYLEEKRNEKEETSLTQKYLLPGNYNSVFIVHGHATGLKEAVARLLEHQGIKPVSLQEKANPGLATIIEKFETNSADVDAAICLFTADDVGGLAISEKRDKRARQNVILETGFFIGKLGRDRVIIIKEDGVEIPSDLAGVDLPTANKADWKSTVLQTLAEIGYSIDKNR